MTPLSTPAKRRLSIGLIESQWKALVHMAHAYPTKSRCCVSFGLRSSTFGLDDERNTGYNLWSPLFALPPGSWSGHDKGTWIPLFSLYYFHHEKDSNQQQSQHQAHTMDGIVIGRSPMSNALLVYNPQNQQYYKPDRYRINPCRLPTFIYANIKYDGGLFCHLLHDNNPHMEEKYPPPVHVSND
jgi:hypothetical protein